MSGQTELLWIAPGSSYTTEQHHSHTTWFRKANNNNEEDPTVDQGVDEENRGARYSSLGKI